MTPPAGKQTPETPSEPAAVQALLRAGLAELALATELAEPLSRLALLLEAWAARMSLTGHRNAAGIAQRLILDALALARQLPDAASLADLGSGAGFPGLPIAVAWPDRQVTLVESRERRHHFQRAAVRALGLANAHPLRGRAEQLPPRPCQVAVAQAMAEPGRTARWLAEWVEPGGWIAIPGAEVAPELPPLAGFEAAEVRSYQVPLEGPRRTLWLARRRS